MLKSWQVLENINRPRVYFFVVWIFSLVCLRFVVVWWNVCSALSLDKWWSLGVNSRVSQLQGIPAVFWDSICVYIYFFLLYFLWFFFSHFFLRLNHLRALIWLQTFQILPIIYPLLSTHKKKMMKALPLQISEILKYISKCKMSYIDQKWCIVFFNLLVLGYSIAVLTTIAT